MAKDTVDRINQTKLTSNDLESFNRRIKKEISKIKVYKMNKKNPKNINLLDFVGFIDTKEETDCMKDHDTIF
jgi:benzoyl-CoA reductase/2-hydroxyglutaryl-CoA dehydratase subunit BcrC/BadD/HgdB